MDGPLPGIVLKREQDPENDPECAEMEVIGRVKVQIPGELEESAWAYPLGFGSSELGLAKNSVPPIGAVVAVWRVKDNTDHLWYLPAHAALEHVFPEFEHPDVFVAGDDRVRLIYDRRDGQRYATIQLLEMIGDEQRLMGEARFDVEGRALRIYAKTGILVETDGQLSLDAKGDIEIAGRKVARGTVRMI